MRSLLHSLGLLVLILQIACSPRLVTPGALPSPTITRLGITPALAWMEPAFQRCAAAQPGIQLVIDEAPANQLDQARYEFFFQWGGAAQPPDFAAILGQDELAVVVNPANPLASLPLEAVVGLFSGRLERWSQVKAGGFDGKVTVYRYAASEDVQAAASWLSVGAGAILAPDPAAVRQSVASEPYSAGYLPARWVDASVRRVTIDGIGSAQLSRPVLAMAPVEPQGVQRAWLSCVQEQLR